MTSFYSYSVRTGSIQRRMPSVRATYSGFEAHLTVDQNKSVTSSQAKVSLRAFEEALRRNPFLFQ